MNKRQYTPTELGMLFGMIIGGAIGVILFAITNDARWFAITGLGLSLGLGIGAMLDSRKP